MPDKARIMSSSDDLPLYVKYGAEAPESVASQRTGRVAQWVHSIEIVGSALAQSDFRALLRDCPNRLVCEPRNSCLLAQVRLDRVLRARFNVAQARAPQARRADPSDAAAGGI